MIFRGAIYMKPPSRSHSIGTKVTEEEFARLEACAAARGLSVSEWFRQVVLAAADNSLGSPREQTILAEVIALRTIVVNLIYAFTGEGKITKEQMAAFIERADKTKLKRAMEFLAQVRADGKPGIVFEEAEPGKPGR